MPKMRGIIKLAAIGVFTVCTALPAFAQSAATQNAPLKYDLESLGEDLADQDAADLCAEFTPELQKLAGCGEEGLGDPTLEDVNREGLEAVSNDGASPFGGVDPTQDVMNGLPGGGGGGGFDAFGGAIDDLTGGLIPGDL